MRISLALSLSLLLFSALAQAASEAPPPPPPAPGQGGPGHPPPREAMQACAGKHAGDSVSFSGPRGDKIAAHCHLIAMPDHPPAPGQ